MELYNKRSINSAIAQIVLSVIFFTLGMVDGLQIRYGNVSLLFTPCWIAALVGGLRYQPHSFVTIFNIFSSYTFFFYKNLFFERTLRLRLTKCKNIYREHYPSWESAHYTIFYYTSYTSPQNMVTVTLWTCCDILYPAQELTLWAAQQSMSQTTWHHITAHIGLWYRCLGPAWSQPHRFIQILK